MSEVLIIGSNNEIWRGSDTSEFYETEDWDDKIESFKGVKDVINNTSTVAPEDVRGFGEWLTHHDRIVCSNCHKEFTDEVCCCDIYGWFWNFCPNCGAKMKEEQD